MVGQGRKEFVNGEIQEGSYLKSIPNGPQRRTTARGEILEFEAVNQKGDGSTEKGNMKGDNNRQGTWKYYLTPINEG